MPPGLRLALPVREQPRRVCAVRGVEMQCHRACGWRFRCVSSHGERVPFGVWGGHATGPAAGAFGA
ncbi:MULTISPECIES: hypothetical protein [Halomonadaceae]|uniref:hypothetical protein n=1 Tax=Halomonadaceae TaxID=28256 RepID=UPI0011150975|nr:MULTISPECIES: hypothetical protein [Halomonas]MCD1651763.1 hypothetical protein [Halomonas axialensis]MCO7243576.1 hypothetical protein [Halomonas sp. Ps84H-12]MCP1303645.1 hypothetical protein [Halomonas sp. R1t8]MCP1329618.1 hypothetical protein [Halomonas sp. R1t4]